MDFIRRIIPIQKAIETKSVLLLGPRRTGKSALLRHQLKPDQSFDLLKSDTFQALSFRPSTLRETLRPEDRLVVIDEIQKLPSLLDEVHSMIEERGTRFVLTGSSARKLRRSHTSLMGGRARRLYLHPFCYAEVSDNFELSRVLHVGALPPVFLQSDAQEAWRELKDYAGDYLREEIIAEAVVRKIESFSRFLPSAASTNGELLKFEAIASDSQVPARTIREYYAVLADTLIGRQLEPLRFKAAKARKSIATSKFYFFDCGVLNALIGRKSLSENSPEFGNLFETWVFNELVAYLDYHGGEPENEIRFWRSPTGEEVDFVVQNDIAIEVKSTRNASERNLSGLDALHDLQKMKKRILVTRDPIARRMRATEVLPWRVFAEKLWSGEIIK